MEELKRIGSFELDHNVMERGFYAEGSANGVFTYDLRFKKPNCGDYIATPALHSVEHMFATVARNGALGDKVVYFGPMGCRTGFYFLLFGVQQAEALEYTKEVVKSCLLLEKVPGTAKIECGNYLEHDFNGAVAELKEYLKVLEGVK